jgi:hypothetical protein
MCHWGFYWDDARAIIEIIDAGGEEVRKKKKACQQLVKHVSS